MPKSLDDDLRALEFAAKILSNLANDRLYSDAFRHRITNGIPEVGYLHLTRLFITIDRLEAISERLGTPNTPPARRRRRKAAQGSVPPNAA